MLSLHSIRGTQSASDAAYGAYSTFSQRFILFYFCDMNTLQLFLYYYFYITIYIKKKLLFF